MTAIQAPTLPSPVTALPASIVSSPFGLGYALALANDEQHSFSVTGQQKEERKRGDNSTGPLPASEGVMAIRDVQAIAENADEEPAEQGAPPKKLDSSSSLSHVKQTDRPSSSTATSRPVRQAKLKAAVAVKNALSPPTSTPSTKKLPKVKREPEVIFDDELAPIVEIEDEEKIDTVLESGNVVVLPQKAKKPVPKKTVPKKIETNGNKISKPPLPKKHSHAAASFSSTSSFSSSSTYASSIYAPPQRATFQVRHHPRNQPKLMDIDEIEKFISPLPSPSPSPPPEETSSTDPRRYCTALRQCFANATLIEFDKWGFVSSPPEARELFRDEGLRCVRNVIPAQRCHTLHAEILSLLPASMVTSWRGMGGGGNSQKFLWLTEQQILRFGLQYHFERHRPMPESRHQRFIDRVHKSFGKDFEGEVIALQPNFQQADFPLHTDQPSLEGFGNKIITVGVYGEGWIVIRDKDGKKSFKFKVGRGDAWAMCGRARWEWTHGVLCES